MLAQPTAALTPTDATVGQNLQVTASVSLNVAVPRGGLRVTLTSGDPSRLLLASTPDGAGVPSITVNMQSGGIREPEFFLHGLGKSGTVSYTASAPGIASGTGKVTLAPSALVISGPFGIGKPSFLTTTGAAKIKIGVYAAMLDSSMKYVATQQVAGGHKVTAKVTNSNPSAGTISTTEVTLPGGASSATLMLQPVAAGDVTLTVAGPPEFSNATQFMAVTAKISMPGLGLTDDMTVGQNLQTGGSLSLGEPAPAGGLTVTLTSSDPSKMLLSAKETEKGSQTLTLKVPAGATNAMYYIQALAGSGTVTYSGSAPGYRSRTATIGLAPTGVLITGPLSITRAGGSPGFVANLSTGKPTPIMIYTAFLDPVTRHSADVTVQPLRAGLNLSINVTSSNPAVGTIASPVTIKGGSDTAETHFTPLQKGITTVAIVTPDGYTASSNATTLKVIVQD